MKYVMFDNYFPVVFQESIGHNEILVKGMKPSSAGFVTVDLRKKTGSFSYYLNTNVFGESVSLKLKPREKDLEILEKFFDNY